MKKLLSSITIIAFLLVNSAVAFADSATVSTAAASSTVIKTVATTTATSKTTTYTTAATTTKTTSTTTSTTTTATNTTKTTAAVKVGTPVIVSNLDAGTVSISYTSDSTKTHKVLVTKDGKKISYYIKTDGVEVNYPLQYGNGEYTISILENTTGNSYRKIKSENVTLALDDQKKVYLNSVQNINWNEDSKAIEKARELTEGLKTDEEKISVIYKYIVQNFSYDYNKLGNLKLDYTPDIDDTIESATGICYDFSSTFAAMLRSLDIPAKLVKGYAEGVNGYHAWNEVYFAASGKWITIDTTYDAQMRAGKAKYTMEKASGKYSKVNEY